jgi:hypothetical protein
MPRCGRWPAPKARSPTPAHLRAPARAWASTATRTQGDACDADDDNDNLLDVVETNTGVFVSETDTGSNPLNADSDGDGFDDGIEVLAGSDPNDPESVPTAALPALTHRGLALLMGGILLAAVGALALRRRHGSAVA